MKAFVFPGQGAQFPGMGKDLFDANSDVKKLFDKANSILGFNLTEIMFQGTTDDLKQTRVTQPAIFLHSVALALNAGDKFNPKMAAGHSLGEFSALVACGAIDFENGLKLVYERALAMQDACEIEKSGMAAVLNLDNKTVIDICNSINETVVPANFNSIGQIVISGSEAGISIAIEKLKEAGARRVIPLMVGGAFHSPLMEPARKKLAKAIENTRIIQPKCPIYQNADAKPHIHPKEIMENLIKQLTSPVLWTQTIGHMIADGATTFVESGPGNVLQGLIRKINKDSNTEHITQ